ncbi:MAG: 2-C-methyl-D-erythritol 4-phosphate cytidylyltransferase [Elusimicrobia bacterium RIFCSPLOWO2_01_FULL_59_12]|nr:MAG: 2-C-methyl-D-erythritol 4-phosphate cytidylyltransferase [Elusimicrobia bacterium RIFCSPLOWO2_01_FULL_59_12]
MKGSAAAVVVAGGQGTRFGGRVRKQYLMLSGRPLLWWPVDAFQRSPSIGAVILVVPAADLAWVRRQFARWKVRKPLHIVTGGKTRADSVRQGLAAVPSGFRWIAVHDAVRPLVTPELVKNVLKEAWAHRAAIAACPSIDTVKLARPRRGSPKAADGSQTIQRTLPRQAVWLAQTPQVFERKLLERAHRKGRHLAATDDAFLVERLGVRVKLVASSPDNLKVTVPSDLKVAQRLLKARR